jgi:hypothetical protein
LIVKLLKTPLYCGQLTIHPLDQAECAFDVDSSFSKIQQQQTFEFPAILRSVLIDLASRLDPCWARLRQACAPPSGPQRKPQIFQPAAFRFASQDDVGKERAVAAKAAS